MSKILEIQSLASELEALEPAVLEAQKTIEMATTHLERVQSETAVNLQTAEAGLLTAKEKLATIQASRNQLMENIRSLLNVMESESPNVIQSLNVINGSKYLVLNHMIKEAIVELRCSTCVSLAEKNVYFIGDLIQKTEKEMLGTPHVGRVSLQRIKTWLDRNNLRLGMKVENWQRPTPPT